MSLERMVRDHRRNIIHNYNIKPRHRQTRGVRVIRIDNRVKVKKRKIIPLAFAVGLAASTVILSFYGIKQIFSTPTYNSPSIEKNYESPNLDDLNDGNYDFYNLNDGRHPIFSQLYEENLLHPDGL
jgi:hypothetical protein